MYETSLSSDLVHVLARALCDFNNTSLLVLPPTVFGESCLDWYGIVEVIKSPSLLIWVLTPPSVIEMSRMGRIVSSPSAGSLPDLVSHVMQRLMPDVKYAILLTEYTSKFGGKDLPREDMVELRLPLYLSVRENVRDWGEINRLDEKTWREFLRSIEERCSRLFSKYVLKIGREHVRIVGVPEHSSGEKHSEIVVLDVLYSPHFSPNLDIVGYYVRDVAVSHVYRPVRLIPNVEDVLYLLVRYL